MSNQKTSLGVAMKVTFTGNLRDYIEEQIPEDADNRAVYDRESTNIVMETKEEAEQTYQDIKKYRTHEDVHHGMSLATGARAMAEIRRRLDQLEKDRLK